MTPSRLVTLMPYHNNLYDSLVILSTYMPVSVATPKSVQRVIYTRHGVDIRSIRSWHWHHIRIYHPGDVWRLLAAPTSHILLKHHYDPSNFIPAVLALMRRRKIVIMIQQIPAVHTSSMRLLLRVLGWLTRWLPLRWFAVTRQGYDAARRYVPTIRYLPACIDPKRFSLASNRPFARDQLHLISVAKYQRLKNLPVLIDAVAALRHHFPKLNLTLTLIGVVVDPVEFERVKHVIAKHKASSWITLLTEVKPTIVQQQLASAHIAILASNHEALGYAVVEAMAVGLPVITTTAVGAHCYIEPGRNGWVVKPNSAHEIQRAVRSFLTEEGFVNHAKLAVFGKRSRDLIQQHHTPTVFLEQIKQLL